jgi:hypothetical protein
MTLPDAGSAQIVLVPANPLTFSDSPALQDVTVSQPDMRPATKSEDIALTLSLFGTLVPTAAGLLVWATRGDQLVREYGANGDLYREYYAAPNPLLPVLLIAGGLLIGPSLGHFYIGELGSLPQRFGIITSTAAIAYRAGKEVGEDDVYAGAFAAVMVGLAGCGLLVIEAIADIGRVPGAVRHYNETVNSSLSITPTYSPGAGVGLRLDVSF